MPPQRLPFLKPVFFLLAGPNGAGKSTLYRSALASGLLPSDAEFVNADLHEAHALQHISDPEMRSAQARAWADARRAACLARGLALLYDTSGVGRQGISGPKLVARCRYGVWHWQVARPPAWAKKV